MVSTILEPTDASTTAAALADAARQRLLVVPRGSGTKLAWVETPADVIFLSTKRLKASVQHFSGDLVATIPGGTTLSDANTVLAQSGQWLPLDPAFSDRATIGGVVSANDSGPRRYKYGSPRDLIIGIELALCDGRVVKAGGRVVKNVAGYDLSRLMCGSFGSLAVITSATFKLAPLAPASLTVTARCQDISHAALLALRVAEQPVTPSALEIAAPAPQVLIRFETTAHAARQMATAICGVLDKSGAATEVIDGEAETLIWKAHESSIWDRPGLVAKISVFPTEVGNIVSFIAGLDARLDWAAIGRGALGVLLVRMNGSVEDLTRALDRLRMHVTDKGGTLVVLKTLTGVARVRSEAESGLMALMSAVKSRFDPTNLLPPFPGP